MVLLCVAMIWILSSIGIFLRDLRQFVGVVVTMLMFLSPIFYPIEAIPENYRIFIHLNPLAFYIEQLRAVTLFGRLPDFWGLGLASLVSILFLYISDWWFHRVKKGFADVI